MSKYHGPVQLAILDISGTICDGCADLSHIYPNDDGLGVKAPVIAFEKLFHHYGLDVDWETIRSQMGTFKKIQLRNILKLPNISAEFKQINGREWTENDVNEMFDKFRPTVAEVCLTDELITPFPGVAEAINEMQENGIKVACDTGFPKEAGDAIYARLEKDFGIKFDAVADAEATRSRPSPFWVYDCMHQLDIYPVEAVVKADDISAGVHEAVNAGAWAVGLYGRGMQGYDTLRSAGADYLLPSVAQLPNLIYYEIQPRLLNEGRQGHKIPTQQEFMERESKPALAMKKRAASSAAAQVRPFKKVVG